MLKRMLKNQKGLTLIELLVVVVILGIIAAIAIPSVGGLIDNSRKDAHIGNAQQMINSARLYVASEQVPENGQITLENLVSNGYIEPVEDPWSGEEYNGNAYVTVRDNGTYTFTVTLHASENGNNIKNKPASDLNRTDAFTE